MKAWFFGLQPRERWIVTIGAAAAVVIVVWGLVLRPLQTQTVALREDLAAKQRLLADVVRLEGAQPGAAASNVQRANQTLVVVISETANTYGLGQPRTRNNGPSTVDVTFQGVAFDSVVDWLIALRTSYGIEVETASFNSAREPGLVNGQISLHRL
jgi:general secretion pathway protein M